MSHPLHTPTIKVVGGEIKPGYIGFSRTTGVLGRLIQVGEKWKFGDGEYNHAFVVVSLGSSHDDVWIVQATLKGVILSRMEDLYPTTSEILLVPPPSECDPEKVAVFAHAQVGEPYGLLSDVCIAVDILTPVWFWSVRRDGTWICSALAAESLRYAGMLENWPDIYGVTPTQLKKRISK
jgi:hypothetical protein